jgi:hypothetical protein
MKTFLGIDPGANGGIAAIRGSTFLAAWKMPATPDDLVDLLAEIKFCMGIDFCVVEKQGARPAELPGPDGTLKRVQGITSTWSFAENYGIIEGVLAALQIPREFVAPSYWQKNLQIPPREKKPPESHTDWKNRLRRKAQELYPEYKITLAIADAILIAEFCRRVHTAPIATSS